MEDTLNKGSTIFGLEEYASNYSSSAYQPARVKAELHNYYDQIVKNQYKQGFSALQQA